MKKYGISIDAMVDNCRSTMTIFSQSFDTCPFDKDHSIYKWLREKFPLIAWTFDDGFDFMENPDTDYCQYVSYCDAGSPNSYLLASFNVTEE